LFGLGVEAEIRSANMSNIVQLFFAMPSFSEISLDWVGLERLAHELFQLNLSNKLFLRWGNRMACRIDQGSRLPGDPPGGVGRKNYLS
jgi:hypothetical protein